jgi:hypothetical protein
MVKTKMNVELDVFLFIQSATVRYRVEIKMSDLAQIRMYPPNNIRWNEI